MFIPNQSQSFSRVTALRFPSIPINWSVADKSISTKENSFFVAAVSNL